MNDNVLVDEQALNKKLAEFAGFVRYENWEKDLPDFPQSLDACFKWLVPESLKKLMEMGYAPPLMALFTRWYDEIVTLKGDSSKVDTAALALCLAIEKLIDKENV